jgi:hypothetical protein
VPAKAGDDQFLLRCGEICGVTHPGLRKRAGLREQGTFRPGGDSAVHVTKEGTAWKDSWSLMKRHSYVMMMTRFWAQGHVTRKSDLFELNVDKQQARKEQPEDTIVPNIPID